MTVERAEYRGAELVRKFQKDYFAEKAKEVEERKAKWGNKRTKKEGEGEGKEEVKEEVKEEEFVLPKVNFVFTFTFNLHLHLHPHLHLHLHLHPHPGLRVEADWPGRRSDQGGH